MIYYVLLVLFLLLMGAVISGTFAERSLRVDRPPIYWNDSFMQLINMLWVPAVIILIILLILNWKITLITGLLAWLLCGRLLSRIAEYAIVLPLHKFLIKQN